MENLEAYNRTQKIPFQRWEKHPDGTPGAIFYYQDANEAERAWAIMKRLQHPAVELDKENARVLSYSDGRLIN